MLKSPYHHLIVAGVPRSGSASLYTYLLSHPEICGSTVKETQHFLPASYGQSVASLTQYLTFFSLCDQQNYYMEASPSYFYGGKKVARKIEQQLEDVKLIIILRHPVDRFFSYFTHEIMFGNLPKTVSFDQFVFAPQTTEKGLIRSGFYVDYLAEWFDVFQQTIYISFFDNFFGNPKQVMQSLSTWLEIDPMFYEKFEFTRENRGAIYKNRTLHMMARAANGYFETFLRRNLTIKRWLRTIYYAINESTMDSPSMSKETRDHLEEIYKPYNQELCRFLLDQGVPVSGWLQAYAPNNKTGTF